METKKLAELSHDLEKVQAQVAANAHAMHALLIALRHGMPGICDAMHKTLGMTANAWLQSVPAGQPGQEAYTDAIATFRAAAGAVDTRPDS